MTEDAVDEVVVKDLPATIAALVVTAASIALGVDAVGVVLEIGLPPVRSISPVQVGPLLGLFLFGTAWCGLLIGLLVLRRRRSGA